MDKIQNLIKNIEKSDLSRHDKDVLINAINEDRSSLMPFLREFFSVVKFGKDVLKDFDIDIEEWIDKFF